MGFFLLRMVRRKLIKRANVALAANVPTLGEGGALTTNADAENDVEYISKCQAEYYTATFAKRVLYAAFLCMEIIL